MKNSRKKVLSFVDYFCILMMTINRPLPFDKLFLFVFLLLNYKEVLKIRGKQRVFFLGAIICATMSFFVNLPESSVQIFYPILFILAGLIIANKNYNLRYIRNIFFINILFGILCAVLADIGYENEFSRDLHEKGFPFLYGPLGFSATNQVYGTFCILHLLISYEIRKFDFFALFAVLGLLMTMNRASWVFLACIWFWYRRKTLFTLLLAASYIIVSNWKFFQDIFDTGTLESRDELREGVQTVFWNSKDWIVLLFGFGNSKTTEDVASLTIHNTTYVENGLDFIAFAYGYLGLVFIGCTLLYFLISRLSGKKKIFSFFLVYLVFEQWLTQEFMSSSFMFFFGVMFIFEKHYIGVYRNKYKRYSQSLQKCPLKKFDR